MVMSEHDCPCIRCYGYFPEPKLVEAPGGSDLYFNVVIPLTARPGYEPRERFRKIGHVELELDANNVQTWIAMAECKQYAATTCDTAKAAAAVVLYDWALHLGLTIDLEKCTA